MSFDMNDGYEPLQPRKRKKSFLVPVLLGIIIGILLVTVALPRLAEHGLIPNRLLQNSNQRSGDDFVNINRGGSIKQNVSVDVSTQVTEVVKEVSPAVVGVTNLQKRQNFWGQVDEDGELSVGSGVIYKKSGSHAYVVTNHHVIEGADEIEVVLYDDTKIAAKVVGSDLFSDLAVLEMDGKKVDKVIEIGSSGNVKVGEPAIAIGNPLGLMFSGSVTQGVISGTERTVPQDFNQDGQPDWQAEVIQTDAAINPGNSGGALINIAGQLIGINSMKINQAAVEGIGFAIPIDTAVPLIEQLEKNGEVIRPYLGVEAYSLDEVPQAELKNTLRLPDNVRSGIYIWNVERLSPAEKAGIKRLDVVTELDGKPIENVLELRKILYQDKKVGDYVQMTVYRDGKKDQIKVKLTQQQH